MRMPSARNAFSAAAVVVLTRIGNRDDARGLAADRHMDDRSAFPPQTLGRIGEAAVSMPSSARYGAVPSTTFVPPTMPIAPLPVGASKSRTGSRAVPRSLAAFTMAAASGCSLACSTLAARRRSSASSWPSAARREVTTGLPCVKVPVLSTISVSTFSRRSSASALRMSTPACAPRPTPTMIDIGVARPSAHGQAMMRTVTAATSP